MIVGDHSGMPGVRGIHERRYPAARAVVAQNHRSQIEPHRILSREIWPQVVADFDLFFDEPEISRVEIDSLFNQLSRHRHRPECRNTGQRQFGGFDERPWRHAAPTMSWSARNVPFNAGEMSRLVAGAMLNQPEDTDFDSSSDEE
ncbi:MAG: hypothetical protein ACLP19_02350 [Xanthobacteraceae bacterium]